MRLGDYEVGRELGSGAMGSVHLAYHRLTRQPVALKRIHTKYVGQNQTLRRFNIEVQTASRLRHPNIVGVIESGMEPRGTPYCVMEWVSGAPLTAWSRVRLPWRHLVWIVSDLLDALAYAHARGVIHRDLKPANILVEAPHGKEPRVRLVDFGIARLLETEEEEPEATALTMNDRVLGTPAYLSPEQAQAQSHLVGPHTDLYALGVLIFELTSGRLPFEGLPILKMLMAHVSTPPPPLDLSDRSDIPRDLPAVVRRLLGKRPEERPDSAAAVREALGLPDQIDRVALPRGDTPDQEMEATPTQLAAFGSDAAGIATDPSVAGAGVTSPVTRSPAASPFHSLTSSVDDAVEPVVAVPSLPEGLVGRDDELHQLEALADEVIADHCSRLAVVYGEAGIGKSCLVREARYRLEERGDFRGGRMLLRGGVSEDEVVKTLIARLLYAERLTGDALRKRLIDVGDHYQLGPIYTQALTAWFSPSAELTEREDRVELAAQVIRCVAASKPLVLVVEGPTDSDAPNFPLAVLEKLFTDGGSDAPFLVLTTVRSPDEVRGDFERLVGRVGSMGLSTDLTLGPVDDRVLAQLVRPLVGSDADNIALRAAGNPLFAIELARFKAAQAAGGAPDATLPLSIADIWQSRISQTVGESDDPQLARSVLLASALLGPTIRRRHLVEVVSAGTGASAEAAEGEIDRWIEAGVLEDDGARSPSVGFVHTLAYEYVASQVQATNPAESRLLRHIADWATARRAGADPDVLARLARLLEEADEPDRADEMRLLVGSLLVGRLEYNRAEAVYEAVRRSAAKHGARLRGVRATAQLAHLQVLRRDLEQAAAVLSDCDELLAGAAALSADDPSLVPTVELMQAQAELDEAAGRYPKAASRLTQAVELTQRAGETLLRGNVRSQLSRVLEGAGELTDAERQCRLATQALEKAEAPRHLRVDAHISLASLCRLQGRQDVADEAAVTALELAESVGARRLVDRALAIRILLADDRGDYDQALEWARRVLDQRTTFGDAIGVAKSHLTLGVLERHRGALRSAEAHHQASLSRIQEQGSEPQLFGANLNHLGILFRRRRRYQQAIEHHLKAADVYAELGSSGDVATTEYNLAMVLRLEGQLEESEKLARHALQVKLEGNDFAGAAHCQMVLGFAASQRQNWSIARELFSEARSMFAHLGIYREIMLSETWLALAELGLGNPRAAEVGARDVEEQLRRRPVYKLTLLDALDKLAAAVGGGNRELAWRLQDRAGAIEDQLVRRST